MYYSLEFNESAEAGIQKGVLQEQIFFKLVVLQRLSCLHDQNPLNKLNFGSC